MIRAHRFDDCMQRVLVRSAVDDFVHGSETARQEALRVLVDLGGVVEPVLMAILQLEWARTTEDALDGLGQIGSPRLMESISRLLSAADEETRLIALRAAHRQSDDLARGFLEHATRDPSPRIRRRVLTYLSWRESTWAIASVRQLCHDADSAVKWAAIAALATRAPAEAREVMNLTRHAMEPVYQWIADLMMVPEPPVDRTPLRNQLAAQAKAPVELGRSDAPRLRSTEPSRVGGTANLRNPLAAGAGAPVEIARGVAPRPRPMEVSRTREHIVASNPLAAKVAAPVERARGAVPRSRPMESSRARQHASARNVSGAQVEAPVERARGAAPKPRPMEVPRTRERVSARHASSAEVEAPVARARRDAQMPVEVFRTRERVSARHASGAEVETPVARARRDAQMPVEVSRTREHVSARHASGAEVDAPVALARGDAQMPVEVSRTRERVSARHASGAQVDAPEEIASRGVQMPIEVSMTGEHVSAMNPLGAKVNPPAELGRGDAQMPMEPSKASEHVGGTNPLGAKVNTPVELARGDAPSPTEAFSTREHVTLGTQVEAPVEPSVASEHVSTTSPLIDQVDAPVEFALDDTPTPRPMMPSEAGGQVTVIETPDRPVAVDREVLSSTAPSPEIHTVDPSELHTLKESQMTPVPELAGPGKGLDFAKLDAQRQLLRDSVDVIGPTSESPHRSLPQAGTDANPVRESE